MSCISCISSVIRSLYWLIFSHVKMVTFDSRKTASHDVSPACPIRKGLIKIDVNRPECDLAKPSPRVSVALAHLSPDRFPIYYTLNCKSSSIRSRQRIRVDSLFFFFGELRFVAILRCFVLAFRITPLRFVQSVAAIEFSLRKRLTSKLFLGDFLTINGSIYFEQS